VTGLDWTGVKSSAWVGVVWCGVVWFGLVWSESIALCSIPAIPLEPLHPIRIG
jgi:hypothetical protein